MESLKLKGKLRTQVSSLLHGLRGEAETLLRVGVEARQVGQASGREHGDTQKSKRAHQIQRQVRERQDRRASNSGRF